MMMLSRKTGANAESVATVSDTVELVPGPGVARRVATGLVHAGKEIVDPCCVVVEELAGQDVAGLGLHAAAVTSGAQAERALPGSKRVIRAVYAICLGGGAGLP